ncbi:hypothetical protein [Actinomadura chibensis]|uniref:Uncharacterized protein n=1 Tax=Actinomadura chibensis TaxID=392828 RepID=A0A5D0NQJ2_9ACTN|nr:hypothetical protein [Actinomadura chibensis]TYB46408.1 hypothetical protein FXF69_14225 [Actinomadura chibensis]
MAVLLGLTTSAGCGPPSPGSAALPGSPQPCASRTRPTGTPPPEPAPTEPTPPAPTPTETKLAWRAEELPGGAVRMTIGDVAAAPRAGDAVRVADYRAPASSSDCDRVRIVRARGWWCATTVRGIRVSGEIVVGGAEPRARIEGGGFGTRCAGPRPGRMRQVYRVERDSWSGWRGYGPARATAWTTGPEQSGRTPAEACPAGRVGTYNYRLTVRVEIEGATVGDSRAAAPRIRADCGTGVS